MESLKIRQIREEFWKSKKHKYLPEVPLPSPKQDKTTLFNQAGMQQLIPYLNGKPHELGRRLFNIQKCIRTIDIDEVGDKSHLTMFEMMGNWSLGDYFKKESIYRSYEFLTKYLKLDTKKLAVTVFKGENGLPRDSESASYWEEVGIPKERISYLGSDNRRSPGPVGPCGSDTEIFYRIGKEPIPPKSSNVENDENNRIEIWNNVFMEYYRDENGKLTKLPTQNVDTGMGFDRIIMIMQNKNSVFETDQFQPIIKKIEQFTNKKYQKNTEKYFRIVADHIKTIVFLINDGVIISNTGAGYILKMLIRRFYYNLINLDKLEIDKIKKLINDIISILDKQYPNFVFKKNNTISSITQELIQFQKTISNGTKLLEKIIQNTKDTISGKDIFDLYDRYGFPIELTKEIAQNNNLKVDKKGFDNLMSQAKEKSRSGAEKTFDKGTDRAKYLQGIPQTEFVGYQKFEEEANLLKEFEINGQKIMIFDKTPFYGESGGQTGDTGIIIQNNKQYQVEKVLKYEGVFLHFVS